MGIGLNIFKFKFYIRVDPKNPGQSDLEKVYN